MLFRKYIVSTRALFQLIASVVFVAVGVGTAVAANPPIAPLLVPYEINTIAGTPQYNTGTLSVPIGYYGEGVSAAPYLDAMGVQQGAVLSGPFTMAVDSVGNVYITDSANAIIREINAQTGAITTVGGTFPKGCSGNPAVICSLKFQKGCADGVLAYGSQIGSNHMDGIAVDAYGNVYFDDNTLQSVSVIYRGGAQVANFIKLVNPAGVAKAGGVLPGYVYHVAGTVDLTACSGSSGNTDNAMAFQDNSNPPAPAAPGSPSNGYPAGQLKSPKMLHLDSAGNIYIADTGNATVRVINTQATDQTFFQYTVHPGYMRSITNCSALTTGCPSGTITGVANNGINGPVNAIVFQSQYVEGEADAFGNVYQTNGTGSGTGPPGIYGAFAYAGGAPLTNLLIAETPSLSAFPTPPELNAAGLPTYGSSYIGLGNPALTTGTLPNNFVNVLPTKNQAIFDVRPAYFYSDNFGSFWFYDTHYPELHRIDQYTSLATLFLKTGRATASVTGIYSSPASFTNPWYCVYGSANATNPQPWTQGPQSYDPQGDGCPTNLATFSGSSGIVGDSLGNIIVDDGSENLIREISVGTTFPPTQVGAFTGIGTAERGLAVQYPGYVPTGSVVQAIQVHFDSSNPPATGATIPDGAVTGVTTTAFSIPAGNISDFTIDSTDPEFPFGSVWGSGPYTQYAKSPNFAMWAGLPTCTQLGQFPNTPIVDYDCLVYVKFAPTVPGVRQSNLVVTTANNSKYSFPLYGTGVGGQLAIDGGAPTVVPATGLGTTAGIAVAQSGIVYIADPANDRIVVETGGTQTNLTFTGVTPATLSGPMGVAVDAAANIYVSDTGHDRVLKVNPLTGVATVLGNNVWIPGSTCDGASPTSPTCPAATLAKEPGAVVTPTTAPPQYAFKAPQGLAVDSLNNVYVADTGNSVIVEIPANIALGGAVPLQAYQGAPQFKNPVAVAVDSRGNIWVADPGLGGAIVELPPGGGDLVNVPGSSFFKQIGTAVGSPNGIAVDAAGNLYVSDGTGNQVVEIPAIAGVVGGDVFPLNFTRVDAAGNVSSLNAPAGVALDASGNLYVADSGNKQVLFDNRQNPLVNFGNVPQAQTAAAQPVCQNTKIEDGFNVGTKGSGCLLTVTNIGNQPISVPSPITSLVGTGNAAFSLTDTCSSRFKGTVPAGLTCTISPTFAPTADNGQSETVNVSGGSQTIALTANGVGAQPLVNIILSAAYTGGTSTTTPTTGATATVTATVTQPHIAGNVPTGPVVFTYKILGDGTLGTPPAVSLSGGKASFVLPTLLQGRQYTVNANYTPGDSLNSATVASPLVLYVPGVPVTVTAASVSFVYGITPPAIVGTVTGITDPLVTYKFTSSAGACTPIGVYPVTVVFSGGSYLTYGFPPSLTAGGAPATVTETAAPLTYTLPNFTAQYGAADLNYSAGVVPVGTVCSDLFNETFTPSQSSLLNVGTFTVVPTVTGPKAGNYTVTAPPSTLTITKAPVLISITAAQTAVLNTAAAVQTANYQISVGSTVPAGKGTPSGTVTITDAFIPIISTGYGPPAPPVTIVVPLVAGFGTYTPTDPTPGVHQYSYAYSGDANFQTSSVVPAPGSAACIPSAITANCLVVDTPDFTLTSPTGPIIIIPGVVPSGNGLLSVPGQASGTPETAVLFVNKVLGFVGQVSLACQTQNPKYVSCFMTPLNVCFATSSSASCTNTSATAATVLAVQTPATLPLGFQFSSNSRPGITAARTVLAFLPFGFLAFCVRRRRRLSKALWMLIAISAVSVGMSGCGGNKVSFYTPIPTGPQTVTVTATYLGNGGSQPASTRVFIAPINID